MSVFDSIKRQLRSVIEWENPNSDDIFYRWTENGDEIKNASKLIIGPGQGCIFVYQGRVVAVYTREMTVDLQTANIPFWTTVSKFMQAFQSEYKVGLYFFKTTKFLDQKWGTSNIIKYEDQKYGFPVGLKAYGNYTFLIKRPKEFFTTIVGSGVNNYTSNDLRQMFNSRLIQPLSDYFAEARYTYTEIDNKREEIAVGIHQKLESLFSDLGFDITDFRIEGISFDDNTMNRINKIADMTAEAIAAKEVGLDYAQNQKIQAMRDAAKNEGGGAGIGMGMGAGIGMGNMMANAMENLQNPNNEKDNDISNRLIKLKSLFTNGLISEDEYKAKKSDILKDL